VIAPSNPLRPDDAAQTEGVAVPVVICVAKSTTGPNGSIPGQFEVWRTPVRRRASCSDSQITTRSSA